MDVVSFERFDGFSGVPVIWFVAVYSKSLSVISLNQTRPCNLIYVERLARFTQPSQMRSILSRIQTFFKSGREGLEF